MLDILAMPFMLRAFAGGIIIAFLGSFFGSFVVQRKMSFLGSGLAHSAFGGIALGLLLGIEPIYVAFPFTLAVALIINYLSKNTRISADTGIGVVFSFAFALGTIFIALKDNYSVDAFSYLFGSIITTNYSDLIFGVVVLAISAIASFKHWNNWAYATFDKDLATADGINTDRDDYILTLLIALTVVVSVKIVGIVLVTAFLVLPPAAAKLISDSFYCLTIRAVIIGIISVVLGLFTSVMTDLPSGAVIIIIQTLVFFLFFVINKATKKS
jgi:zinc transport system permease protein